MRNIICMLVGHKWSLGHTLTPPLSHWRGCDRCGKAQVQAVNGRWVDR